MCHWYFVQFLKQEVDILLNIKSLYNAARRCYGITKKLKLTLWTYIHIAKLHKYVSAIIYNCEEVRSIIPECLVKCRLYRVHQIAIQCETIMYEMARMINTTPRKWTAHTLCRKTWQMAINIGWNYGWAVDV